MSDDTFALLGLVGLIGGGVMMFLHMKDYEEEQKEKSVLDTLKDFLPPRRGLWQDERNPRFPPPVVKPMELQPNPWQDYWRLHGMTPRKVKLMNKLDELIKLKSQGIDMEYKDLMFLRTREICRRLWSESRSVTVTRRRVREVPTRKRSQ